MTEPGVDYLSENVSRNDGESHFEVEELENLIKRLPETHRQVFNLLATFQPLKSQDLVADVFPFIIAQLPVMGGFQYHHTKRAIQSVQAQIQKPTRFAVSCPGLCATPNGNVICDLFITYANAVVVLRIYKASWPQLA